MHSNTARFVHACMRKLLILTEFYYYMYWGFFGSKGCIV